MCKAELGVYILDMKFFTLCPGDNSSKHRIKLLSFYFQFKISLCERLQILQLLVLTRSFCKFADFFHNTCKMAKSLKKKCKANH